MRKFIAFISFVFLSFSVSAVELGGIEMPDSLQVDGQELLLNGAGIRSKFVFDLYVIGLYPKYLKMQVSAREEAIIF